MKQSFAVVLLGLLSMIDVASAREHQSRNARNRSYASGGMMDRQDRSDWRDSQLYRDGRYAQGYRDARNGYDRRRDDDRSTAASVAIVAGSAGAGAAIGGISAGRKGAVIGAIAGGVAGAIYDQATRNNDDRPRRRR